LEVGKQSAIAISKIAVGDTNMQVKTNIKAGKHGKDDPKGDDHGKHGAGHK
jgi:hypothetical protein